MPRKSNRIRLRSDPILFARLAGTHLLLRSKNSGDRHDRWLLRQNKQNVQNNNKKS